MRCLRMVWSTMSVFLLMVPVAHAQWTTFFEPDYGFEMSVPADWIVTTPDNGVTHLHDLAVLAHYELNDPLATHTLYIDVLDNPAEYPLELFLDGERGDADVLIERHLETGGAGDIMSVGFVYDPPLYGAIGVEIEYMVAHTPDTFVYLLFYVAVDEQYEALTDHIVESFSAEPILESTCLGDVKALYRY